MIERAIVAVEDPFLPSPAALELVGKGDKMLFRLAGRCSDEVFREVVYGGPIGEDAVKQLVNRFGYDREQAKRLIGKYCVRFTVSDNETRRIMDKREFPDGQFWAGAEELYAHAGTRFSAARLRELELRKLERA